MTCEGDRHVTTMFRILVQDSKDFDVGPWRGDLGVSIERILQFASKEKSGRYFKQQSSSVH